MFIRTIALMLLIGFSTPEEVIPAPEDTQPISVYEAVLAGKTCHEDAQQNLWCRYKVGHGLDFKIGPFGDPWNTITFFRSDHQGDYYAKFGMRHGCVIVSRGGVRKRFRLPGTADTAFVLPKNGKVYRFWEECQTGM